MVVDEPTTKLAALTSGELDFAGIQPAHAEFVRRDSNLTVLSFPLLQTDGIVFNTRRPPFDRLETRRAVSDAIDRRELVDAYIYGFGTPALGPVPPTAPGYLPPASSPAVNSPRAPGRVSFELLTVGSGEAPLEQMLQARLKRAGFDVTIRQLELSAFLGRVYGSSPDFDAAVLGIPGDPGLGYLGPLARLAGLDATVRSCRRPAPVCRFHAGGLSVSLSRSSRNESTGARGHHGSARGASYGARLVGGAVSGAPAARTGPAYSAAAPVRLDLAGGWTDVPPFSAREGGVVVTGAIQLFARAEVRLGGTGFRLVSEDLHDELEVSDSAGLVRDGRLDLLKAGLRMLPVGGCTLSTRSDAPPGSGLGSSGALDVALVAALSAARGESPDPVDVAERACHLEAVEAGIPGGRQDQFASSHGGFLRLDFRDPEAEVRRLKLDPEFAADLARRIGALLHQRLPLLRSHNRPGHAGLRGGETRGWPRALHGLRRVAEEMADALVAADSARVGQLLTENWTHQQALDPRMCTEEMARLERSVTDAGALGGKAAGSGAGGCMFFLGPDDPAPVIEAARACGAQLLPVRWAMFGVRPC